MKTTSRYKSRGVSSLKEDVHKAIEKLDQGLFPGAFCKINEDYLTGDPKKCCVIHCDGAGTKSIIAYLQYKETEDASIFKGIAQDSIVMNLDDLICVGAVNKIVVANTINRNVRNVPGEVLEALVEGTEEFLEKLRSFGVDVRSGGGETADVGDLTGTLVVDSTAVAVMDRTEVIDNNNILPGMVIVGLASYGKASYEEKENSGVGSNGLTSARHDLLNRYYAENYQESFDRGGNLELQYCGPYRLNDPLPESRLKIGEAILSPTRTYAPVIAKIFKKYAGLIKGLIHCSGGGQTKCLRFGQNVHYVKDNLFEVPPLFKTIQIVSGSSNREMYSVFNMGHRMEIYCEEKHAEKMIACGKEFDIEGQIIGKVEDGQGKGKNSLSIVTKNGELRY